MEIINGDIFKCNEDILVHQVNCQGVMGSGLAKQVKKLYPEVFKGYEYYCKTRKIEDILGTALICEANDGKYIANLFGQNTYGKGKQTDYEAFKNALVEIHDFAKDKNLSVAIPYKIGSNLGGGDWNTIFDIITEVFSDNVEFNIYKLDKGEKYV